MRFVHVMLLTVLAATALPGLRPAMAADHQLTIGIAQFPANFNPLIDTLAAKTYILSMAERPITAYDKDWRLVCLLCTRLPTAENGLAVPEKGPDGALGVALTFTIPDGARWADGVPVDSDDVVFTWEVGRHPQSGVSFGEEFRHIRTIDVKDAHTFTLHIDQPTSFDYSIINDFWLLPKHLEKAAFAVPGEYRNRTLYETDPTNPGLYFGPYRIARIERGQFVELVRNPTWYGQKPAFDRIVVKAIPATQAIEANLLSHDIDMAAGEVPMSLDQALAFERHNHPQWVVVTRPGLAFEHISVNVDDPILADVRVRRALLAGLNRQALVQTLSEGRQSVADTYVNPLDWYASPTVVHTPFDPAAAARLLDEAGWRAGADGKRRNAKGETLHVELMTTAGDRGRELSEQIIQQDWRRLGIEVSLRNQPARTFFSDTVLKHAFPSLALFAWVSSPEEVPRLLYHSSQIPGPANGFAGENAGGYQNPRMDALIEALEREQDKEKRRALWAALQDLCAEDLPDLPLTFRADPFILPVWLKGVEPTGQQAASTLWIENWRDER
jgi:peptide/nickel transport system substrate-binding protein